MARKERRSMSGALGLARPAGASVETVAEPDSGFDRVIKEAGKGTANDAPKPVQRSREGMAKLTVHMRKEARQELRGFAMRNMEGQEEFVLKAINERLERMHADFEIS